ncbi:helix-turn-helix domain-containing protein [Synechococcus sp. CBW1107]|uniref:helix-turn-helix domain-containing protein n=1 Tax=Synechococcus sp. CBW1107 TaxID=2789857 RepID=UPI003A103A81
MAYPKCLPGQVRPLTDKQRQAAYMRACGDSWDQIGKKIGCTVRTLENWRKHPAWDQYLEEKRREWVAEYETTFTRMMPEVAQKHRQLVHSQSEAIAMRAVDSAHANHVRCVREQETKSEVEELKEMVKQLLEQLAQERAKG